MPLTEQMIQWAAAAIHFAADDADALELARVALEAAEAARPKVAVKVPDLRTARSIDGLLRSLEEAAPGQPHHRYYFDDAVTVIKTLRAQLREALSIPDCDCGEGCCVDCINCQIDKSRILSPIEQTPEPEHVRFAKSAMKKFDKIFGALAEIEREEAALDSATNIAALRDEIESLRLQNSALVALLENPPFHKFWLASEPDCPKEIKTANGQLHTLRCKVCGHDHPRSPICHSVQKMMQHDH